MDPVSARAAAVVALTFALALPPAAAAPSTSSAPAGIPSPGAPDPAGAPDRAGAPDPAGIIDLSVYDDLGTWIDIYDTWAWRWPARTVRRIARHGVSTIYLETANYTRSFDVYRPEDTAELIKAAHRKGIAVVAWYLPGFDDLDRDLRRSLAAIRFHRNGHRFDSFALDIESPEVRSAAKRSNRLIRLSRRLRNRAPSGYALGAIIPSPRGMELAGKYWPDFPYAEIDPFYDVWLPMGYYTWHGRGYQGAYDYTALNTDIIRTETGDPAAPIHPIGGIASQSSHRETRGYVDAVIDDALLGGGLYDFGLTGGEDWDELQPLS
jgi:hypothetical protein